MKRDSLDFARGVVVFAAIVAVIVAAATWVDLRAYGYPLTHLAVFDYTDAHFLADLTNRGLNQLTALSFTVVAIAVPLTANLYSLKFLDLFIKDRVNAAVLSLVVVADLVSFWTVLALKQDFIPFTLVYLSFGLLLLCLCVLFPYLLYVFTFLHPNTLLSRLENEICGAVAAAVRPASAAAARQAANRRLVAAGIEHVANIGVRSVERTDRATAIASVITLERVARAYWSVKANLPQTWFQADPGAFQGFSSQAVADMTAKHTWVEMLTLWQLRSILSAAVPRTHDVADTAARALRHLGMAAPARGDPAVCELVIDYFNTFLRLALNRNDVHTAFALLDHYRQYAQALNGGDPPLVLRIAYYFQYYALEAHDRGLWFLVKAAAHDLGALVQFAYTTQAPNRQKLFERFMCFDNRYAGAGMRGIYKAQAILASYFLLTGQTELAEIIRRALAPLAPAVLADMLDDLEHIRREAYWEISERQTNIDYVPEPQREKLREFFANLSAGQAQSDAATQ